MANPAEIGAWAYDAGFRTLPLLTEAIALAGAHGQGVKSAGGLWGIGGAGDGPAQAAAAFARHQQSGWSTFPSRSSPLVPLLRPGAAAIATAVIAARKGKDVADGVPTPGDVADRLVDSTRAVAEAAASTKRIVDFLTEPSTWQRTAKILIGFIVLGGAWMVVWQGGISAAGKSVGRVASKAVKATKGGTNAAGGKSASPGRG